MIEISKNFLPIVSSIGGELKETLECIQTNPQKVLIHMPPDFVEDVEETVYPYPNNLSPPDYDFDGGFIGRKRELNDIKKLVLGELFRVVTISGAGGVGKTALAHRFCQELLSIQDIPFDGIVRVSAKEEKLTMTGIEPIEASLQNYEDILDNILETFGWHDDVSKPLKEKEESVQTILRVGDKGLLLVVDNLETIRDQRVSDFLTNFPPPSKVLITSRQAVTKLEFKYPTVFKK